MARSVTFIHAADLHLGAPFRGLRAVSPVWADRLVKSIPDAYRKLIDETIREQVDFLIIAGDAFDASHPSYADFCLFRDGLERLHDANIPVYFCTGNHDPYARWAGEYGDLPENVHLFDPHEANYFVYEKEGESLAVLGGRSYYTQAWPQDENIAEGISHAKAKEIAVDATFQVGVIHSGLDIDPTRSPVKPKDLLARKMDYWALGHIHDRREVCREPLAAYPGCTQGLHINEPGEKGCLLVTAEARSDGGYAVRTSFRPLGPAVWKTLDMDLGGAASLDELENRLRTGLDRAAAEVWSGCEMLLVRLRLQGRTELDGLLRKGTTCAELADRLREDGNGVPRIWIKDIDVATRPCVERGALLEREDLLGEVFRLSEAARTASGLQALREGPLAPLFAHARAGKALEQLTDEELARLLDDAESLCLDLLEND